MSVVLGVSAFYHDSAACVVRDGHVVAAAQEERFTRVVGESRLPLLAAKACFEVAQVESSEVDLVVFYEKPLLKLERILENHLDVAPRGIWQWRMLGRRLWSEKLGIEAALRKLVPGFRGNVGFVEHHESHAASAFLPSPFESAAVLTIDGVGEWATASWGKGEGSVLRLCEEMCWPASLGLLYSAITVALGFRVNRDEYKVMGLAAYGTPRFVDWLDRWVVERAEDGTCRLRTELLAYQYGRTMIAPSFFERLGEPLRGSDGSLTSAARDLAASVQCVLEDQVLAMARYVRRASGESRLCLAGGVAYNCVANGRLREEGPFKELWIQPAAGDAGGSVGAALLGWYRTHPDAKREVIIPDGMSGALLGPYISQKETREAISTYGLRVVAEGTAAVEAAAEQLAKGSIVAIASGRMEFGPRALGNRSILADPRVPGIQARLNEKVKNREAFRPFAPVVLEEYAHAIFLREATSPYMLETARVRGAEENGFDWRSLIAGAVHIDGTARVQTVRPGSPSKVRQVLEAFERRTGCPVLINTSFNQADVPIAASASDSCEALVRTDLAYMLLGDTFVERDTLHPAVRPQQSMQLAGSWLRSLLRRGPEAIVDLILVVAFAIVVIPISLARRAVSRGETAKAGWKARRQPASDLFRLF